MKNILILFGIYLFSPILWLCYRLRAKGYENLTPDTLKKPGGVLFLPNHPATLVDPVVVNIAISPKFPIRFTSGTESAPKGVPLTHGNILYNQRRGLETIPMYSDDVVLSSPPPFHSFGFCVTGLIGLLGGIRTAFFPNPTDGKGLAKAFECWKATISCGAPTFLKSLLTAASPEQIQHMRLCVSGAEATPPELVELLNEFGKKHCLMEGYGITECSLIISANRPGQTLQGSGKPLEGLEIKIVHPETHEVLALNQSGLVLVRGPSVFSGYINPGLSSPFVTLEGKEWFNTGDIGYLDDDNCLAISGRKIGIIAHERSGDKPIVFLITTFDVDEVNRIVRESGFSNVVKVSKVVKIDEIPIMGTGKFNFRVLEEEFFEQQHSTG